MNTRHDRPFDVILWGATGFTGRLVAEHLLRSRNPQDPLRWALAGRTREKLEAVLREAGPAAASLPLLHADANDEGSLRSLARQARVICSTVGPYSHYGSKLVAACVDQGTDVCDLCGEPAWLQRMIDLHHERARATGARIVSSCGFDSIPSDLGVYFLQRHVKTLTGAPCTSISLRVERMKGGMSGGTVASMFSTLREAREDPAGARVLRDPYALNPPDQRAGPDGPDQVGCSFDPDLKAWTAPFLMAGINTRVVRRSNALMNYPYGKDFRYDEATLVGSGTKARVEAHAMAWGLRAWGAAAWAAPNLVLRALPQPGQGPSRERREKGSFSFLLVGRQKDRVVAKARVTGDRDPGYGATSRMLGQCAICLAKDVGENVAGGLLTPAVALAQPLLPRLVQSAGLSFEIVDDCSSSTA